MSRKNPSTEAGDPIAGLWPGQSRALLKALGILTRDGRLNQDSRRKLKQVLHLVQVLRPSIERLLAEREALRLIDLGAGKSYLGFILYDLIFAPALRGEVISIEARSDLIAAARALRADSGFERMSFIEGEIAEVPFTGVADIVTALHACDTASDDAIAFALKHEARVVALVPCCQAEIARDLGACAHPHLAPLWRHPIERREFGSHLTNVIRALYLEAHGYKVRVTELTGWEHSMKNELILAERHQRSNAKARGELMRLTREIGVWPSRLAPLSGPEAADDGP